jgi:tRNA dimethylallyltransferase
MSMRKIAAVIGSSGIGKSKLAVELCKALHGQAINADALQVKYTEKYNNGTIFLIV